MKKVTAFLVFVLTLLLLTIPSAAHAEMLVINKDEATDDGLDVGLFTAASEASAIFKNWKPPLAANKDAVVHVKANIAAYSQPYCIIGAIMLAGGGYSKAEALEKFPTLEIITWTDECIEYKIQVRFDDNTTDNSKAYGVINAIKKLPDNIEAAYLNCRIDFELFDMNDLVNPIATTYAQNLSRIVDKKDVELDTLIAKIEDNVVGPYNKYIGSVQAGDELSVKVVLDRPYGVLNSGKASLAGAIPDGFSYVPGSAVYTNSVGYTNVNSIDETTGTPIFTINNMPVGENTVLTFKIKANENVKNGQVKLSLENLFQKGIVVSAGMKKFYSSWYPDGVYAEDEYIKNDVCYINASYSIEYDSNGGNGQVVDENAYECTTENGAPAIILGGSALSKKNCKFIGWNTMSDGTGEFYYEGDEILLTENTKLFAIWEPIGSTKPTEPAEPTEPTEPTEPPTYVAPNADAFYVDNPNTGVNTHLTRDAAMLLLPAIGIFGCFYGIGKKKQKRKAK